jgi:hypothetical protein
MPKIDSMMEVDAAKLPRLLVLFDCCCVPDLQKACRWSHHLSRANYCTQISNPLHRAYAGRNFMCMVTWEIRSLSALEFSQPFQTQPEPHEHLKSWTRWSLNFRVHLLSFVFDHRSYIHDSQSYWDGHPVIRFQFLAQSVGKQSTLPINYVTTNIVRKVIVQNRWCFNSFRNHILELIDSETKQVLDRIQKFVYDFPILSRSVAKDRLQITIPLTNQLPVLTLTPYPREPFRNFPTAKVHIFQPHAHFNPIWLLDIFNYNPSISSEKRFIITK